MKHGPLRETEPPAPTVTVKVQNVDGASFSQPSWRHSIV